MTTKMIDAITVDRDTIYKGSARWCSAPLRRCRSSWKTL